MGERTGKPKGRPKGARNKRSIQLTDAAREMIENAIPNAFQGDAHAYLMAIYKNPEYETSVRLDAAKAAAPYEKPKLASTEVKGDQANPIQHKLKIEFVKAGE